jgi:RNA polymerase sigma-70 factor (ECF subfamily)
MSEASKKFKPEVASDVELANAIAYGDESALLELQRRHTSLVRGAIARVLRKGCTNPPDHGKDAEQETWSRVWKYSSRFDPAEGTFEAWLATIAKRRALTDLVRCLKQRENEVQLEEDVATTEAGWAETYYLTQANREWELVEEVMQSLNPEHRAIVELGLFDKIPYAEISGQLGVSVAKIKVVIHRFKKACRERAQSDGNRDEKN